MFFTPYRPWLLQNDLAFFDLARNDGFVVEKILEKVMDKVMFEEDRGVSVLEVSQLGLIDADCCVMCRTKCFGVLCSGIDYAGLRQPLRVLSQEVKRCESTPNRSVIVQ